MCDCIRTQRCEWYDHHADEPCKIARLDLEGLLLPGGKEAGGQKDITHFNNAKVLARVRMNISQGGHAGGPAEASGNQGGLPVPVSQGE